MYDDRRGWIIFWAGVVVVVVLIAIYLWMAVMAQK